MRNYAEEHPLQCPKTSVLDSSEIDRDTFRETGRQPENLMTNKLLITPGKMMGQWWKYCKWRAEMHMHYSSVITSPGMFRGESDSDALYLAAAVVNAKIDDGEKSADFPFQRLMNYKSLICPPNEV